MRPEVGEFWRWLVLRSDVLRDDPEEAAGAIHGRLARLHEGLAVEVGGEEGGALELILSAAGDEALFPLVHEIAAAAPLVPGWSVVALRPPRGFAFRLDVDGTAIRPSAWTFQPLEASGRLGLRLHADGGLESHPGRDAIAWRVVRTGAGEQLGALVAHVEVRSLEGSDPEAIPIERLPRFLEWWRARQEPR